MAENKTVTFDAPPVPCPFCGSTKITVADLAGWEVWCEECGVSCRATDPHTQEGWATSGKAIAAWNTRAPTPAVQSAGQEAGTWRGLTEREIDNFVDRICDYGTGFVSPLYALVSEIEAKLRERNAAPVNGGEREPDSFTSLGARVFNQRETAEQKDDANTFKRIARYHSERAADAQQATAINAELLEAAEEALKLGSKVYHNANSHEAPKDWAEVRVLLVSALAKARGDDNQVECQACYGKGFNDVERQVAERKSDVQTFRETCDACEGTGKVSAGGAA